MPKRQSDPLRYAWNVFTTIGAIAGISSVSDDIVEWSAFMETIGATYRKIVYPVFNTVFFWVWFPVPDWIKDVSVIFATIASAYAKTQFQIRTIDSHTINLPSLTAVEVDRIKEASGFEPFGYYGGGTVPAANPAAIRAEERYQAWREKVRNNIKEADFIRDSIFDNFKFQRIRACDIKRLFPLILLDFFKGIILCPILPISYIRLLRQGFDRREFFDSYYDQLTRRFSYCILPRDLAEEAKRKTEKVLVRYFAAKGFFVWLGITIIAFIVVVIIDSAFAK